MALEKNLVAVDAIVSHHDGQVENEQKRHNQYAKKGT